MFKETNRDCETKIKTVEDTLISFETAKLAKDKGFDLECKYRYYKVYAGSTLNKVGHNVGDFVLSTISKNDNSLGVASLAETPTQSLLQKWLRGVHSIHICVDISLLKEWYVNIYDIKNKPSEFGQTYEFLNEIRFKTYEEALEIGLQEALKLIKK